MPGPHAEYLVFFFCCFTYTHTLVNGRQSNYNVLVKSIYNFQSMLWFFSVYAVFFIFKALKWPNSEMLLKDMLFLQEWSLLKKKKKEQLQLYFRTLHIFLCNLEGEINAQVYLGRKLMWVWTWEYAFQDTLAVLQQYINKDLNSQLIPLSDEVRVTSLLCSRHKKTWVAYIYGVLPLHYKLQCLVSFALAVPLSVLHKNRKLKFIQSTML